MSFRFSSRLAIPALLGFAVTTVFSPDVQAQTRRPMTFEDFVAVRAVSDPQLSPDGTMLLYAVRTTDVSANKRTTVTYRVPVAGGTPQQFPSSTVNASEARWSPDGKRVVYTAGGQLWIADPSGANPKQLTTLNGGASGPVWSPTGTFVVFASAVYPDCSTDACNAAREQAADTSKLKARIFDHLLFRHWTAYDNDTRQHLFVVNPDGSGVRDATPGVKYDIPPGPFGGSEGYAVSPDGKEIAYTAKDQGRADAWSTDLNIYTVQVAGGTPTVITASNTGADANPVYSPDGRTIVYNSQERAGFEADQSRLMSYDRTQHTTTRLVSAWDRNADSYAFTASGNTLYIQTVDHGHEKFFALTRQGQSWPTAPTAVVSEHNNASLVLASKGNTIAWVRDAVDHPAEVYIGTTSATGAVNSIHQATHENDALIAQLQLNPAEEFWFKGVGGDSIQGFVVKPPQYVAGQKYPVLLIIHGGPQSAFVDNWHSRWNFSMFAAGGYAIVYMNPPASPGYGQRFVDAVSKDWGGAPYQDLMMGLDTALIRNASWMDSTRVGAAGASYGGYMVNWIAGHTNRFKALFTHDGVYNLENFYGATEELWFPEWEFGGPYWDKHAMDTQYRVWSPHLFAANMRTPMYVVQGELDYRVPISEGMSLFSALQRQNVPSKLLLFPDEGHWVTKPQNQRLWYHEFATWFDKYLKP